MALAAVALTLLLSTTVWAYDGEQAGSPGVHEPGTGMTGDPTTAPGTHDPEHMFGDAAGHWYEGYAENMAQHGFMNGYTNGEFGGQDPLTRAQFAAVLGRMLGVAPEMGAPFGDTVGHWAEGHIGAMEKLGIIHGHEDGTYGPEEPITRAQMATMMDRALEHLGRGLTDEERAALMAQVGQHLDDVAGHWAEGQIAHMYERGITMGDDAGHFRPDEHTNRAQASAMLWRFFEGELQ